MKVLVTGAAGFIGMQVAQTLAARGDTVVGIDNLNDYYDPALKQARLDALAAAPGAERFRFERLDIADTPALAALFAAEGFERVVHLAAQAGVRYSLQNAAAYGQANLVGFLNMLEGCRHSGVQHLVYASSSSVYGGNTRMPFATTDAVDHPVSLYAATKKANELMAHSYSHLYALPTTGLRFFTVYGPWGRPDMAPFLFARAILAGEPIKVFNHGRMRRDFTFIDDIVAGVIGALDRIPAHDPDFDRAAPSSASSWAPYRLFNIGRSEPVELMDFIGALEAELGRPAIKELLPMQPGDVEATCADTASLEAWTGVQPRVSLAEGVRRFAAWYRDYYRV
ncbi:NAD-dependent epimerase [Derxia lacustris]|uniref:NAD-dependent epimerase n=1 Tax=Derxia lacustris TaxID=764842 RepID=UPI000A171FD2|nr:NAD-dependent epimerase [Derxia lacustris]